jgi:hypothetical protein
MIARIFAEMGIKDLFLGVHCMLRENSTRTTRRPGQARQPVEEVKPQSWPERCAMTVHVGVGSAGKEHDLIVANQRLEMMAPR